jgi:hypothetical protein
MRHHRTKSRKIYRAANQPKAHTSQAKEKGLAHSIWMGGWVVSHRVCNNMLLRLPDIFPYLTGIYPPLLPKKIIEKNNNNIAALDSRPDRPERGPTRCPKPK